MEQLKGTLESGSTVSSSFALPLNLQMISHCGPLADDASVATELEIKGDIRCLQTENGQS